MSRLVTKLTKWSVRQMKTQISLGICPVWSESSLCVQWVAKYPSFLHADSKDSYQSLRWAHRSFCWFCHMVAQLYACHLFSPEEPCWTKKLHTLLKFNCYMWHLSRLMAKPTKWHVHQAKTQISLGIRPVWSESSLSAWRKLGSLATHSVHCEDPDQTGQMPRLIWVSAQSDQSLRWAHSHFICFVMRQLILWLTSWVNMVNVCLTGCHKS